MRVGKVKNSFLISQKQRKLVRDLKQMQSPFKMNLHLNKKEEKLVQLSK
ncbi:hypothetical protein HMPREF0971_01211 [Segatella oris F0302]|uniref:Uncharacterized protein n=1 Tax=Segatella oris F0302 TaxID=649760 RepID=D1QQG2_9BACT|nr:hypothetical protein HMPREF0971_01211 [Segatella oris F0302]